MAIGQFVILTDENIANEVALQLQAKDKNAVRLIDELPAGTPDSDVLEYCHQRGYTLLTHDESITKHIKERIEAGKEYAGVLIAPNHLQGVKGIGRIVKAIETLDTNIKEGTESIIDNVYNQIRYIS